MKETNDGGPAFPCDWLDFQPTTGAQIVREQCPGMTLRDYIATKAMEGWISDWLGPNTPKSEHLIPFAKCCYELADVMLVERARVKELDGK